MANEILLRIPLRKRPTYNRGQLLEEQDFRDEQEYHIAARQQHNLHAHGWGVVHGLVVRQIAEKKVEVGPGYAIDQKGRELSLEKNQHVNLADFGSDSAHVCIFYEEGEESKGSETPNRADCNAVLAVVPNRDVLSAKAILLGVVRLAGGQVKEIDNSLADFSIDHRLFTYGVSSRDLAQELRYGWLTLPFHPTNLDEPLRDDDRIPKSLRGIRPKEFDVGFTEARSDENGAGGNMAFPLPPGASSIERFRIAGRINKGDLSLTLVVAGWDAKDKKHVFEERLTDTISGNPEAEDRGAYHYVQEIKNKNIDPELNTLVLQLLATNQTHVSLVAVEFGYWGERK